MINSSKSDSDAKKMSVLLGILAISLWYYSSDATLEEALRDIENWFYLIFGLAIISSVFYAIISYGYNHKEEEELKKLGIKE